jgi:polyphosphate kinase
MSYTDRDLSWLSFNERILQEAENDAIPVMERLKFVAIYSSNLEEFYKVRVARHHFDQKYKGDKKNKYGFRPSYILQQINRIVSGHQERLGNVFYSKIVHGLAQEGIHLLTDNLETEDETQIGKYFDDHLAGKFELKEITDEQNLQLKNQTVYLFLIENFKLFLIELDYDSHGRFIDISSTKSEQRIIQLDDIFKKNAVKFTDGSAQVYAIKISRDADLYIEEEPDGDIVKKIKKSIQKRETGLPSRLLFDQDISFRYINELRKIIGIEMPGLIPGGRYHNFYDFFGLPVSKEKAHIFYPKAEKVPCTRLDNADDWFKEIKAENVFLSFPYQNYDYVTQFLNIAAVDKAVEEINITLYRVASTSEICKALEIAAKNGKNVFVMDEVQARFDEESNIYWGARLLKAGAVVKYGVDELKVHAKIFTIKRREGKKLITYSYMGTGNFNEKTAGIYGDHALITAQSKYAKDLDQVFAFLKDTSYKPKLKLLMVAPFNLRNKLKSFINNEIDQVSKGNVGKMTIKLNSLEDIEMIDAVRNAADKGVKIDLIVRGICCYHPETELQEKNIQVVSIIDQFLEHTRIYHFYNNGDSTTYLASADWMNRNLSERIEVAFPLLQANIQELLLNELQIQFKDSVKGRQIARANENEYVAGNETMSSQSKMFDLVSKFNENEA